MLLAVWFIGEDRKCSAAVVNNNNNNNELYLHGLKRGLQHYKSILRITKYCNKKIDQMTITKQDDRYRTNCLLR